MFDYISLYCNYQKKNQKKLFSLTLYIFLHFKILYDICVYYILLGLWRLAGAVRLAAAEGGTRELRPDESTELGRPMNHQRQLPGYIRRNETADRVLGEFEVHIF